MIKILFFIDTLTGGGAEKVLRTLVNNMDQRKFDITVQTFDDTEPSELLAAGISYRAINRCKTAWGKKLFSYWIRLCAELKWLYPLYIKDDYDIEAAYLEFGPTKVIADSTNKRARKLAWVHCDLKKKESITSCAEQMKEHYRKYDKVICVSNTVKESYVSLFGAEPEAAVLYNVNDETDILSKAVAFEIPRTDEVTFISVGRLSYEKGNDRLLEACRMLKEDGYAFRLWLVGDGPEQNMLQKAVSDDKLDAFVTFWGFQKNPYPYMVSADVVVCPSRYEGFSTVMTEAMILGKAAVTTPCSGMRELLGESQYGLITEDSVDGLYSGLKKMLDEPLLQKRYSEAASLRGKDFTKKEIVTRTEQFFMELLSEG